MSASRADNTTMGAAFVAAGILPPNERLGRLAVEAWSKHPSSNAGAARRQHITDNLRGEMSWSLICQFDLAMSGRAIGWLLNRTEQEIRAQRPTRDTARAVGGGQISHNTQMEIAPSTSSRDDARPQTERRSEPAIAYTPPRRGSPAAPNLTILADKQAARAAAAVKMEVRLSRLETFKINGQKIGDLTSTEANAWAGSRERDARFVRLLTANLPPDRPIREFRNGEDADELYQRAETQHAA